MSGDCGGSKMWYDMVHVNLASFWCRKVAKPVTWIPEDRLIDSYPNAPCMEYLPTVDQIHKENIPYMEHIWDRECRLKKNDVLDPLKREVNVDLTLKAMSFHWANYSDLSTTGWWASKWWWIGSGNPPKIFLIQVSELWWLTQILGGAFHSRSLVIYFCLFIYIQIRWCLLRILPWDSSPLFTTHWGIFLFF